MIAKKGEGTFSEVIKAQNIMTGTFHAIKCMKNSFKSSDEVTLQIINRVINSVDTYQLMMCFFHHVSR